VAAVLKESIRLQAESTFKLAMQYRLHTEEWLLERHKVSPELRRDIETWLTKLGPPPPNPFESILDVMVPGWRDVTFKK